jgi:hypothetical protein
LFLFRVSSPLGKEGVGEEVFVNRTGGTWLVAVGRATVPACGVAGCPAPIRTTAWVVSTHHQSVTGLEAPARTSFHARFGSCAVHRGTVSSVSVARPRMHSQVLYDFFLCAACSRNNSQKECVWSCTRSVYTPPANPFTALANRGRRIAPYVRHGVRVRTYRDVTLFSHPQAQRFHVSVAVLKCHVCSSMVHMSGPHENKDI